MRLFVRVCDAVLARFIPSARAGACTYITEGCVPNGVLGYRCCRRYLECPPVCWHQPDPG